MCLTARAAPTLFQRHPDATNTFAAEISITQAGIVLVNSLSSQPFCPTLLCAKAENALTS